MRERGFAGSGKTRYRNPKAATSETTMPGAIITSTYRYKRPPRKRKAVPLEGPAIVAPRSKVASASVPRGGKPSNDNHLDPEPAPRGPYRSGRSTGSEGMLAHRSQVIHMNHDGNATNGSSRASCRSAEGRCRSSASGGAGSGERSFRGAGRQCPAGPDHAGQELLHALRGTTAAAAGQGRWNC